MDFQQIRKYVKGVLTNSFLNKITLDKLSTSDKGNLLFDGKEISGSGSSETSNSFYLIDYNSMESVNSRNFIAEKDCYIEVETYANDNKEEHYYINDIFVGRESINGEVIYLKNFFLSKGDSLKLREGVSHSTTIRIFDLLNNKYNYSTEEKIVGKWIDGKPIYEKVIIIDNPTSDVDVQYSHGISNFNHVINTNVVYITNGSIEYSEPIYLNSNYARSCAIDSTKLYITTKGGNYIQLYVTIQYTKTTD